jgi:predicted ester cyclase
MNDERNKEVVRRFVAAINARDRAALAEGVATNVVRHCPATPDVKVASFDDLWSFLEQDFAGIPDSVVTLETLVAEGDLVALWATYSGTQTGQMGPFPPSGARASVEFSGILQIRDGRIAEMKVVWDNVSLLTQLGHMPAMAPNS